LGKNFNFIEKRKGSFRKPTIQYQRLDPLEIEEDPEVKKESVGIESISYFGVLY
jgi:hypothetical protein